MSELFFGSLLISEIAISDKKTTKVSLSLGVRNDQMTQLNPYSDRTNKIVRSICNGNAGEFNIQFLRR